MALHPAIAFHSSIFHTQPSAPCPSAPFLPPRSSSLPFAQPKRRRLRQFGRRAQSSQRYCPCTCRLVCKESKACSSLTLEDEEVCVDGNASWSSLGRLLWSRTSVEMRSLYEGFSPDEAWRLNAGSNLEDVGLIAHNFKSAVAVQSTPPPRQKRENSDKQNYYVNTGYAIRTLRDELPAMFYKDLTYDIYRDDIVFRDPMNTFGGIDNYKLIFWALRFHGRIFFKAIWVDILRVWQPSEKVIMVRWQVRGIPRVPWEAQGIFDGTSEYKLDKDGKIYEHKVDNLDLNSQQKFTVPTVADLVREAGCSSTPKPTYFGKLEFLFWSLLPYLLQFTWVRYYLALKGTMNLKNVMWPSCPLQPL